VERGCWALDLRQRRRFKRVLRRKKKKRPLLIGITRWGVSQTEIKVEESGLEEDDKEWMRCRLPSLHPLDVPVSILNFLKFGPKTYVHV
jgi:hypothetical protein